MTRKSTQTVASSTSLVKNVVLSHLAASASEVSARKFYKRWTAGLLIVETRRGSWDLPLSFSSIQDGGFFDL